MSAIVLVVEDEPQIGSVLRSYLEADGFEVRWVTTGAEALASVARDEPQAVLLDVGLPDMSGLDVLATLRHTSDVVVLMVTARADEVDKLLGLGYGADDYITKPFSGREVVARVKAVLRRTRPERAPDEALGFAGLSIDPGRREVTLGEQLIELSALDFDLLFALASSPGRVFSRAQLLREVWGYDFFGDDRVVDVHVKTLRAALGDDAASPSFIGTMRGIGYKFVGKPR